MQSAATTAIAHLLAQLGEQAQAYVGQAAAVNTRRAYCVPSASPIGFESYRLQCL